MTDPLNTDPLNTAPFNTAPFNTALFNTAVERFAERRSESGARYRLLSPPAPAERDAWPLVIFLHGAGERGDDNRNQLRYLPELLAGDDARRRYACFCLAMQCPEGDKWVDVDWSHPSAPPSALDTQAMQALRTITAEVVASQPIDPGRIYLTGISMGGYGTWHWATAEPELFAAVAPICGGGDPNRAAALKNTPTWAVHGDQDDAVPYERSRHMIAAIERAGGLPLYSEPAGVGHHSWTPAYDPAFGLLDWMLQQRR